ncbi:E3 SUMO-protein ligase PIAS3-like isoform X2 [Artemia franciscana]|uniref:E3 SUMO-protein ligase PIAS3-like isoform X2 n=1 Tax=Artemia franciscana TaxID=6661 RepID=UPI0032DBAA3E
MSEKQLIDIIKEYRISELTTLLTFAGKPKVGRKQELMARAIALAKMNNPLISKKIISIGEEQHGKNFNPDTGFVSFKESTSSTPLHPDVRLKKNPFYDVLAEIVKPSSLIPEREGEMSVNQSVFHLTPFQSSEVSTKYPDVQIQLRFALLEVTSEQDDYFPSRVTVFVNDIFAQLPNPIPTNKPGVEPKRPPRPVDITQYCKLTSTASNAFKVSWLQDYGRSFVFSIYLVRKLTSQDLLGRLQKKGIRPMEFTKGMIKNKLKEDEDSEIAMTSLRVSVNCPLGKLRIRYPCRSSACTHLQCFDASLFLQMNEKKSTWMCPVCDKKIHYNDLAIDGYFVEVLKSPVLPSDCTEIEMSIDGSWEPKHAKGKEFSKNPAAKRTLEVSEIDDPSNGISFTSFLPKKAKVVLDILSFRSYRERIFKNFSNKTD